MGTKDTLYLRKASGLDLESSAISYVDGSRVLKPLSPRQLEKMSNSMKGENVDENTEEKDQLNGGDTFM